MTSYIPVFKSPEGEAEIMHAYQSVLDRWPVGYEERRIPTSFGETHVIVSGAEGAPPVVLLHALLTTAVSWYQNIEALSQGYRVYAVDVIGEGNKSRPTRPISSLDDFLQWFTELIDGLKIDALYLVGNSYGGFTGAYYAMNLPERIRKLVLIGPAATIYPMRPFYLHMFLPKALYSFFPKLPGVKRVMRNSLTWMYNDLPADRVWEPVFYHSMVSGGLINQVFPRVYSREEFARIRAKILLILGDREAIYNDLQAAIRSARSLIPTAQIEVIPNGHHVTAIANPECVNQRILRFFAE
jgi:pimeloyl-ACP methyl ester carboxylesterase